MLTRIAPPEEEQVELMERLLRESALGIGDGDNYYQGASAVDSTVRADERGALGAVMQARNGLVWLLRWLVYFTSALLNKIGAASLSLSCFFRLVRVESGGHEVLNLGWQG